MAGVRFPLPARGLALALMMTANGGCVDLGQHVADRPKSYAALRIEGVVPQHLDYTCGAASLATLLKFYWGARIEEGDVLATLRRRYTTEEIRKKGETGLSFEDLIFMTNQLGFQAQGAKIDVTELPKLNGPVIVHLKKGEYQHFVVLRRTGDGVMYLADPYIGNTTMSDTRFQEEYDGFALTVWKDGAKLPEKAILAHPRDGLSVPNTLWRGINVGSPFYHPGI